MGTPKQALLCSTRVLVPGGAVRAWAAAAWQRASWSPRREALGCPGARLMASGPGLSGSSGGGGGHIVCRAAGPEQGGAQGVGPRLQPQRSWGPGGWRPAGRAERQALAFKLGIFSTGSPGPLLSAAPPCWPQTSPPAQAAGGRRGQRAEPSTAAGLWASLGTWKEDTGRSGAGQVAGGAGRKGRTGLLPGARAPGTLVGCPPACPESWEGGGAWAWGGTQRPLGRTAEGQVHSGGLGLHYLLSLSWLPGHRLLPQPVRGLRPPGTFGLPWLSHPLSWRESRTPLGERNTGL